MRTIPARSTSGAAMSLCTHRIWQSRPCSRFRATLAGTPRGCTRHGAGRGDLLPQAMNCPMHILIYKSRQRSYRELPLRLFELGTVYRFERSGVLNGLLRLRGFAQDDAHIFCTSEQLPAELASLLAFVLRLFAAFRTNRVRGGTVDSAREVPRHDRGVGPCDRRTASLARRRSLEYTVSEGGGAFYAPKIDVHVRDAIGRKWQVSRSRLTTCSRSASRWSTWAPTTPATVPTWSTGRCSVP